MPLLRDKALAVDPEMVLLDPLYDDCVEDVRTVAKCHVAVYDVDLMVIKTCLALTLERGTADKAVEQIIDECLEAHAQSPRCPLFAHRRG